MATKSELVRPRRNMHPIEMLCSLELLMLLAVDPA
jgi:hypothetical protein